MLTEEEYRRGLNFIHKKNRELMVPGSVWQNRNPYQGEGEIILTAEWESGTVKCIHANHKKHDHLNGCCEWKSAEAILRYYRKISE